jgi:hypothetical protein
MTDQGKNLQVVTEHLDHLAEKQQTAANKITGANRMTGDVSASVLATHGLVCSATSIAVSAVDDARKLAGTALHETSSELATKLTTAAINYNDADYMAGDKLGQQCQL